jgi:hypothetical protein
MGGQVLTKAELWPDEKGFAYQEPISIRAVAERIVTPLHVRQCQTAPGTADTGNTPAKTPAQKARNASEGCKRRKQRRGGWPSTKCISRQLCRETRAKAGLLARAGYRFTVFATARAPLGLTDSQAKRHIARSFARLGQALERKGHDYIGLTTYEKKVAGLLHGHALVHVRQDCLPVVRRWADRFDERPPKPCEPAESVNLHARPAVNSDLAYVLKQRRFNGPFERLGQPYERSAPFAGTRVSFTKTARAIIERIKREQRTASESNNATGRPVAQRILDLARAA